MRIIAIIALAIALASCGSTKRATQVDTFRQEVAANSESTSSTITMESADTMVTLPGDTLEAGIRLQELVDSSVLVIENERADVRLKYDPTSKRIRAQVAIKERLIPVKIDRTVITSNVEKSDYKSDTSAKSVDKRVEKTSPLIPWWFWLLLIAFGAGIFLWRSGLLRSPWPPWP